MTLKSCGHSDLIVVLRVVRCCNWNNYVILMQRVAMTSNIDIGQSVVDDVSVLQWQAIPILPSSLSTTSACCNGKHHQDQPAAVDNVIDGMTNAS